MITCSLAPNRLCRFAALLAFGPAFAAAVPLRLDILDADNGQPLPARVQLRDAQGRDCLPEGAQVVPLGPQDRWFVSDGQVRLDVPAGRLEVRIERGPEYVPIKQAIEIPAEGRHEEAVKLNRWINMRSRGYVCGENHLHQSIPELAPQLVAEGLDFGTSIQWWNGPKYEPPAGTGFVRDLEFAGRRVPTSVYDVELEYIWGAVYILGLPEPLKVEVNGQRPNLPVVRQAHEAGALVCYQGGWSREVIVDALVGLVDVVNVCNNNFHRYQFQPRSNYGNLLRVKDLAEFPDTPEGMMRMNTDTWYRLLNCGLRLAAGAGSATGAKQTPVGYNRAYVRAGENPSLPDFLKAWREGRNFVTNGPMIFLTVDGRHQPGDTLELGPHGAEVRIDVEAVSQQPLTAVEVLLNGEVVGRAPNASATTAKWSTTLRVSEGAWIAARCTEEDRFLDDDELARYSIAGKLPRRPCRLRFAHTSPVYVTVDGRGARVAASIDEVKRMIDAFEIYAAHTAKGDPRLDILAAVKTARERLR